MEYTNINSLVTVKNSINLKEFVQSIKNHHLLSNFRIAIDLVESNNKLFALGIKEFEFNFDIIYKEISQNVLVYIQLDEDSGDVKVIECFSGIADLVDLPSYEESLARIMKDSINQSFDLIIEFEGQSNHYHKKDK